MSTITLEIPDELARRLPSERDALLNLLERALLYTDQTGYRDIRELLEFLAGLPTPHEILGYRASDRLQARIGQLLAKNRSQGLTEAEEKEWADYEYLDHLVCIAKAKAQLTLNGK